VTEQTSGVDISRLRAACGRILVSPSPVDQAELPSGLVVPVAYDGDDGLLRGVIIHVDETGLLGLTLATGVVVYYRGGIRLAGHVLLDPQDIYAYEEPDR
jgi:hypothetical protein